MDAAANWSSSLPGAAKDYDNPIDEIHWIESESLLGPSSAEEDLHLGDLFTDPDPFDTFTMEWTLANSSTPARISVSGVKAENGQTLHSTGLTLWRASHILADFLVAIHNETLHPPPLQLTDATILELGAGLGIPSILCHFYLGAALVVVTDGDVATLQNLRQNIATQKPQNNAGTLTCQQLVWGNERSIEAIRHTLATDTGFDVILGSDIIYVDSVVEPLFVTVRRLLKYPNGVFVLAFARRNVPIDFVLQVATEKGFVYERPNDVTMEGVYLFRLGEETFLEK